MVKIRTSKSSRFTGFSRLFCLLLLCLVATGVAAQNYSTDDTTYEYPNYGTYYHDRFVGRKTANGEIFDHNKFTAAHWKIKFGTYVMVTNQNTGLQVIVRINDRCPKHGVIDMTRRAAGAIGIRGCQRVTVRILPDSYAERWAAQEQMFDSVPPIRTPVQPAQNTSSNTPKTNKIPVYTADTGAAAAYILQLGTAATHSDAYRMAEQLPQTYRDKVLIEQLSPQDSITLNLNLRLNKQHAETLKNALVDLFPQASIRLVN